MFFHLCLISPKRDLYYSVLNAVHITLSFIYQMLQVEKIQVAEHDDVIKWKHFPRYWPFVRGIHRFLDLARSVCGGTI